MSLSLLQDIEGLKRFNAANQLDPQSRLGIETYVKKLESTVGQIRKYLGKDFKKMQ